MIDPLKTLLILNKGHLSEYAELQALRSVGLLLISAINYSIDYMATGGIDNSRPYKYWNGLPSTTIASEAIRLIVQT